MTRPKTLTAAEYKKTLVARMGPVADCIRQIGVGLGARPYHVALVRTRWSGGARGEGVEEVETVVELTPTPRIDALNALGRVVQSVGVDESGRVRVSEISPRYTEEQLTGVGPDGETLDLDMQFYWEVTFPKESRLDLRRRFRLASVPSLDATKFQWVVDLEKTSEDRARDGQPVP